jgi:hypothetical protein
MSPLAELHSAVQNYWRWEFLCFQLLAMQLVDELKARIKPGCLDFLRSSRPMRTTLVIAFVFALAMGVEANYAGVLGLLVALWLVASATCLCLVLIPKRTPKLRKPKLRRARPPFVTWTSAFLKAPYHPPAR